MIGEFLMVLGAYCLARKAWAAADWYRENSTGGSLFSQRRGYGSQNGH